MSELRNGNAPDPDMFDVRGSISGLADAVRSHKLLIAMTCLAALGLATVHVIYWPPIYRADALLLVEKDIDPARDAFYSNWDIFRKDDARSEMELITAGPILKEVIEKENLRYADVYHPFLAHLTHLWKTSYLGKQYKALKNRILPGPDRDAPSPAEVELGETILGLRSGTSIEPVGESNVGRLRMKGPSRGVSKIANTLIDTYLQRRAERYHSEAKKSFDTLSGQAAAAGLELDEVANRRLAFAQSHGVTLDFQKEIVQVQKLAELELAIASARAKTANLEASVREIDRELGSEPRTQTSATTFEVNPVVEAARLKRLDLQTMLIQTRSRFREDSPEVREIKSDLANLEGIIAENSESVAKSKTEALNEVRQGLVARRSVLSTDLEGERAAFGIMQRTADTLRERLDRLPSMQTTMRALDREHLLAQEKYQQLALKRAQAAVAEATAGAATASMRVVEYAAPGEAYWPKMKLLFPAALLVGLLLGVMLALVKTTMSKRVGWQLARAERANPLYATIAISGAPRRIAIVKRSRSSAQPAAGQD